MAECGVRSAESTLTRPSDTLSHPMEEGLGSVLAGSSACPSHTLSHRMGEGRGERAQLNSDTYSPKTLHSEIRLRGRLPPEECVQLGINLSLALAHLHRNGLIHRDIKPS